MTDFATSKHGKNIDIKKHVWFALLQLILVAPAAVAEPPLTCQARLAAATNEILPWLKAVNAKIQQQAKYPELIQQLQQRPVKTKRTTVTFRVSESGEIKDLRIWRTSGSGELDQSLLELVRNSGPFDVPPNDLPCQGSVDIYFVDYDGKLEESISAGLMPREPFKIKQLTRTSQ